MSKEIPVVLLVEDDPFVRDIMVMQLKKLGFSVVGVHNAEEALAWAEQSATVRPRAVLSDLRMPGEVKGDDLLKQLRERWPGLHCLLMSGYLEEAEDIPPKALRKPFKIEELRQALGPVLPHAGGTPA